MAYPQADPPREAAYEHQVASRPPFAIPFYPPGGSGNLSRPNVIGESFERLPRIWDDFYRECSPTPFEHSPEPETRIQDAYPVQQAQNASPSKKEPFNRDIRIANVRHNYKLASALLDTQCHTGNWISSRLVKRLGREHKVSQDYEPPNLTDASGNDVVACGIIRLHWKWSPHGTRVHECDFFVFPGTPNLDVVFGVDYILSEGLVTVNEKAMYPMTAHQKATPGRLHK
ncbi:MAG: hypothetical protein Q9221_002377 [Calogaya cf. arnoldii]